MQVIDILAAAPTVWTAIVDALLTIETHSIVATVAAIWGVLGTVLLALRGPRAGWGFVAYLASNAGWIWFAWWHGHWAMLVQQLAFTASSLLGIWLWLVVPWWRQQCARLDSMFDFGDPAP